VGLNYICATAERFFAVGAVLGNMVVAQAQLQDLPSQRLLKHIIRCYLRLSDNPRCAGTLCVRVRACTCKATPRHTMQHNTSQHNITQHNTTQRNAMQHNTTQHNGTQHNTIHCAQGARGAAVLPARAAAQPAVHGHTQER